MNIGIDATALYGTYGGVEYSLWNLLCALNAVDDSHHYTVYIPCDGPPPDHLHDFSARWRWVRLPFSGTHKARRILWQQTQFPRQVMRDGCDLLHAPTYVSPLTAPLPVVLTVYDLIALSHPEFATRLNRLHYGALLPRCIASATRVVVPTDLVRHEVARRVPAALERTRVIPLGVEPLFHETHDAAARHEGRTRYQLPERYLLFVGNFEPKKNLHNLLRALTMVPDAPPLVIIGGARAWSGHDIRDIQAAAGAGRSPHPVISLGYVRRRDLPVLYALCEAFVFPSLAEGFGLPVLEALASGAAVVTSDVVPLPGLADVAAICDPHQPASIAHQIERVLSDSGWRDDLRRKAHAYAQPFTWRRTAEMTLNVYRETQN